jgi:hypothetical protein
MRITLEPGKHGIAWKVIRPALKGFRHFDTVLLRVMHDRRTRIGCENVRPEFRAWEATAHIHDERHRLSAITILFPRIRENNVERRANSGFHASFGRHVDGVEVLKRLVHQLQDSGRCGIDPLANLVQAGAA